MRVYLIKIMSVSRLETSRKSWPNFLTRKVFFWNGNDGDRDDLGVAGNGVDEEDGVGRSQRRPVPKPLNLPEEQKVGVFDQMKADFRKNV